MDDFDPYAGIPWTPDGVFPDGAALIALDTAEGGRCDEYRVHRVPATPVFILYGIREAAKVVRVVCIRTGPVVAASDWARTKNQETYEAMADRIRELELGREADRRRITDVETAAQAALDAMHGKTPDDWEGMDDLWNALCVLEEAVDPPSDDDLRAHVAAVVDDPKGGYVAACRDCRIATERGLWPAGRSVLAAEHTQPEGP